METETLSSVRGLAPVYISDDDNLRLRVLNSGAGVAVAVLGRYLTIDGKHLTIAEELTPSTDRLVSTRLVKLAPGWLQNIVVMATAGAPRRGQTWAILELVRGYTGAVIPIGVLVQGYVTETSRLPWPGAAYQDSTEGRGAIRAIVGTDPAAGAESSETVPTNARWRVLNHRIALVTDATVANRTMQILIDDGTNTIYSLAANANQPASTTFTYHSFPAGAAGYASGNTLNVPIPPEIMLMGGSRLRTSTGNLQAGDNYGPPLILVEEWIED